ncbi:MAG: glucose PTS transporter subunit IIA [Lachnospiraceae bacterium]
MAKQVRDYKKLAEDIKNAVGESNIVSATHCATRLRLVLKKVPDDAVTKKIEQMPGVIQVAQGAGQYQVVIGTHAKDVYEHLMGMMSFSEDAPEVKTSLPNRIIAMISNCITPYLYVLAAGGLLQGCLIIIKLFADIGNTGAAQIYDMISWTPFTFLPVFIAVAGAKYCKCNPYIALWCCLALTNPTWSSIAGTIAEGTPLHFLFIPLTSVTYTSTVIPPIIMVFVLSKLEHWLEKKLPDMIRPIAVPFLCTVIMVPLTIIVIGPISTLIANGLAEAYNWLYKILPWLASGALGALWQVLVIFGVHWSFAPISIANFANLGYDLLQPCQGIAVCAQTAACFGVFWKTRNKNIKNEAGSAAATGLFGITEPAIYGITLRFKKPFICGCIGAAAGAVTASFFQARYFVFSGLSGFLSIPNAVYNSAAAAKCEALGTAGNYSGAITGVLLGTAVACVVAFVLVQIVGFDDPAEVDQEMQPTEAESLEKGPMAAQLSSAEISDSDVKSGFAVYAPMNGEVKKLQDVPDATFADGILGQGAAIIPSDGKLYAPFDCTVDSVFETRHAISLAGPDGSEMLIHVGLETVSLGGKYFTPIVKSGDKVRTGDLLMEFDLEAISKQFNTITPILITNADEYAAIAPVKISGKIQAGELLYTVK